jgi:hypothetical protein
MQLKTPAVKVERHLISWVIKASVMANKQSARCKPLPVLITTCRGSYLFKSMLKKLNR